MKMRKHSKAVTTERGIPHTGKKLVFLSYAMADGKIARMLCDKLETAGIPTWYQTRDIKPGDNFLDSLNHAFRQCQVFVVILTNISMKSRYLITEMEAALERKFSCHEDIVIIPILVGVENVPDDLRYYLSQLQFFNALNQPLETVLDSVVKRVQEAIKTQEESAS